MYICMSFVSQQSLCTPQIKSGFFALIIDRITGDFGSPSSYFGKVYGTTVIVRISRNKQYRDLVLSVSSFVFSPGY